jgi:hypothetical protein
VPRSIPRDKDEDLQPPAHQTDEPRISSPDDHRKRAFPAGLHHVVMGKVILALTKRHWVEAERIPQIQFAVDHT